MKPRSIAISPLALALALGVPGAARAAECPDAHPVTGTFRAVQVTHGTVITFPPQTAALPAANSTTVMRGLTFSGAMTGLDRAAADREMSVTLQLDLVRFTGTGQGYGTGEMTVSARPSVPFMAASTAFHGRLNAVITASNQLTGYFAATGEGEFTGATLRGRFNARLATASSTPGPTPNPFGAGPTNPLGPGSGGAPTNPLSPGSGSGGLIGPLTPGSGGGNPTNPLQPGSGGAPTNPFTGTSPVGGGTPTTTPASGTTAAIELSGTFGGPGAPAVIVENDPMALVPIVDAPDLTPALAGIFPLVQPTSAHLTTACAGGQVTLCPGGTVATRRAISGKGSVTLKAGRSSARYRVELSLDTCANDTGYAQGHLRLFSRGPTPVYEGTVDGVLTPQIVRGKLVRGRFIWSGFLALNAQNGDHAIVDSLRSLFTALGTFSRGNPNPFRLDATLGDADDPFVRVMSGVRAR